MAGKKAPAKFFKLSRLCDERNCGRVATHKVNEVSDVCDYHAEGAKLEGWLVEEMVALTPNQEGE